MISNVEMQAKKLTRIVSIKSPILDCDASVFIRIAVKIRHPLSWLEIPRTCRFADVLEKECAVLVSATSSI